MACQPLSTYIPPLPASTGLDFLSQTTQSKAPLICYPLYPLHFHPTIAFVNMDSVHFYQPLNEIRRPGQWRSAASNFEIHKERDNAITYRLSSSQSGRLEDYNSIEYLDLTASPLEDSFHSSLTPVLDSKSAELHAEGTSRRL